MNSDFLRLRTLDAVSLKGDRHEYNEDRVGATECGVWALDGATSAGTPQLSQDSTDAEVLVGIAVEQFSQQLRTQSIDRRPVTVLQNASVAIRAHQESCARPRGFIPPLAAAGLATLTGDELAIAVLADITVIVVRAEGSTIVAAGVPSSAEATNEQILLRTGDRALVQKAIVARRTKELNRPGGDYWALNHEPRAVHHAQQRCIDVREGDLVFMSTDGFSRAIVKYGLYPDWSVLMEAVRQGLALDKVAAQIREVERDDASCRRFPRLSRSDDTSAILVLIEAVNPTPLRLAVGP